MSGGQGHVATYQDIMGLGRNVPSYVQDYPESALGLAIKPGEGHELTTPTEVLYRGLGQLAETPLVDRVVDQVLQKHPEFSPWGRDRRNGSISVLFRDTVDLRDQPMLTVPETNARRHVRTHGSSLLLITHQIVAVDLHDILNLERSVGYDGRKVMDAEEVAAQAAAQPTDVVSELVQAFRDNWPYRNEANNTEDRFSPVQTAALGLLTHFSRYEDIGAEVGASASTISRLFKPIMERYGVETPLDLMLLAVAAGAASVDHIPAGRSKDMGKAHLAFFKRYFSNDPEIRREARSVPQGTSANHFKRAADRVGVTGGSREVVKCLIRDGDEFIDLPRLED